LELTVNFHEIIYYNKLDSPSHMNTPWWDKLLVTLNWALCVCLWCVVVAENGCCSRWNGICSILQSYHEHSGDKQRSEEDVSWLVGGTCCHFMCKLQSCPIYTIIYIADPLATCW